MKNIIDGVEYEMGSAEEYEAMRAFLYKLHKDDPDKDVTVPTELESWKEQEDAYIASLPKEDEIPLTPEQALSALFDSKPEIVDDIPDQYVAKMAPYFPAWSGDGVSYEAGKRVSYNLHVYKILQSHISQGNWNPEDAPSLFAKVLIPDPTVIPEWEQPSSTNPYMKGDKVKHNGHTWICDIDNNVWEPGVYGWTIIE